MTTTMLFEPLPFKDCTLFGETDPIVDRSAFEDLFETIENPQISFGGEGYDVQQVAAADSAGIEYFQWLNSPYSSASAQSAQLDLDPHFEQSPAPELELDHAEQSTASDPVNLNVPLFNNDLGISLGNTYDASDLHAPVQGYQPDPRGIDRTMTGSISHEYGTSPLFTQPPGPNALDTLGIVFNQSITAERDAEQKVIGAQPNIDLRQILATPAMQLFGTAAPQELVVQPNNKRRASDISLDSAGPSKRARGRPPKHKANGQNSPLSQSASSSSSSTGTPVVGTVSIPGKKPRKIVPDKYLKDGSAVAKLGMSVEQIKEFSDFDKLLTFVAPHLYEEAVLFGHFIEKTRGKAAVAAKKSRDDKNEKIEFLESKVAAMETLLRTLVQQGVVDPSQVNAFV